jgi:hypothetical protein
MTGTKLAVQTSSNLLCLLAHILSYARDTMLPFESLERGGGHLHG